MQLKREIFSAWTVDNYVDIDVTVDDQMEEGRVYHMKGAMNNKKKYKDEGTTKGHNRDGDGGRGGSSGGSTAGGEVVGEMGMGKKKGQKDSIPRPLLVHKLLGSSGRELENIESVRNASPVRIKPLPPLLHSQSQLQSKSQLQQPSQRIILPSLRSNAQTNKIGIADMMKVRDVTSVDDTDTQSSDADHELDVPVFDEFDRTGLFTERKEVSIEEAVKREHLRQQIRMWEFETKGVVSTVEFPLNLRNNTSYNRFQMKKPPTGLPAAGKAARNLFNFSKAGKASVHPGILSIDEQDEHIGNKEHQHQGRDNKLSSAQRDKGPGLEKKKERGNNDEDELDEEEEEGELNLDQAVERQMIRQHLQLLHQRHYKTRR